MAAITVRAGEGHSLNILGMNLRFLCEHKATGSAWSLMEEDIPLGAGAPPHRHDWDEAYYILEGALDFEIDGKSLRAATGDFAYLPRNTIHGFRGATKSARVLIFAAPAHATDFFEDLDREVRTLRDDLAKIPEIGLRHGIEFMPDPASVAAE